MSYEKVGAERFLHLAEEIPICDVRSPSEFNSGHIPGAVNIPIFSDKERESVGIRYKREDRISAIKNGLDLVGSQMSNKLHQALKVSKNNHLLIHCWRGGMRSEAMAWLLSLAGIDIQILEGGYKAYRRYILDKLSVKRKMIILGGLTGSSKTHIINHIRNYDRKVIDMEGLANHKGSAFGALGQLPQPTTEHFANLLYDEWRKIDPEVPVWLEDESRNIGTVFIPEIFYDNIQNTPVIVIMMDVKTRLPRLIEEYSKFPKEELIASIMKISKRLGGDNTRDAISAVEDGDMAKAVEISLAYYDKAYLFGLSKKNPQNIIYVHTETDNIKENAVRILEAADKINWGNISLTDF